MLGRQCARVIVAEDHKLLREQIVKQIQDRAPDAVEVVAEARNGGEAIALVLSLRPDVVLMDVHMPVCSGIAASQSIRAAGSQTMVLLMSTDIITHEECLGVGACGFLSKVELSESLPRAILECAHGCCPPSAKESRPVGS